MSNENNKIDFGFKEVPEKERQILVSNIFDKVSDKYDLMNDIAVSDFTDIGKRFNK